MQIILGIIVFILILGAIVVIHEAGHFIVAKKSGILCYEFAIGMGPVLFQKKFKETVFSIRAIPIGGFVSMAGEDMANSPIKGYDYAKITLDSNNRATEIFVLRSLDDKIVLKQNINTENFYRIISSDLMGTEEEKDDELFICLDIDGTETKYLLNKDCKIRFDQKTAYQMAPYNRLFFNKPLWKRFLTVFAGPFMNFVLAFFIFFFLGLATGYTNYKSTVIGETSANAPAAIAGIQENDKILYIGIEDEYQEFTSWNDVSNKLKEYASGKEFDGTIRVVVQREGESENIIVDVKPYVYVQSAYLFFKADGSQSLEVNFSDNLSNYEDLPSYKAGLRDGDIIESIKNERGEVTQFNNRSDVLAYFYNGIGAESTKFIITVTRDGNPVTLEEISTYKKQIFDDNNIEVCRVQIGVSPTLTRNFGRLIVEPFKSIGTSCTTILKTLGALFKRNSGINITDLSGPVGIASATVNMIAQGPVKIFDWMAILSVNIGLMNLIPLPALDGGRLAFIAYEAITRKRANAKVENIVHTVGFIILMALFVFVAFNDVFKLFK